MGRKSNIDSKGLKAQAISEELALALESIPDQEVSELFVLTRRLRLELSGERVFLCSIVNARSGRCGEDCRFCAQSAHYQTGTKTYPLMSKKNILAAAKAAKESGAREFSIVTSGKGIEKKSEAKKIRDAIAGIVELGLHPCVSCGMVDEEILREWKAAGLSRFHHNLETARSFFPEVCTTHDYEEDVDAVRAAKQAGLPVCVGGIFGMGETWTQRVELAIELRELEVDSVPLNFLNPIPGTPMAETAPGITPLAALKTIALFRFMLPQARIIVCGGRKENLRELQALIFEAGANGLMIGNYLTTLGRPVEEDLQMIADLGLEVAT